MFALVLAAAAGDAEYDRLFGPEPPPATVDAPAELDAPSGVVDPTAFEGIAPAAPSTAVSAPLRAPATLGSSNPPEVPGWVFSVLALGMGGAAMWWLKQRGVAATAAPLQVLHRQPIGDRSSLVLVEVLTADGERRRLLVGTGGGAPTLVSDLGGGFEDVEARAPAPAPLQAAPPRVSAAPAPPTPVMVTASAPTVRVTAGPRAANIADEVLAERRTRGRWLAVAGDEE